MQHKIFLNAITEIHHRILWKSRKEGDERQDLKNS
jgi:hypothetical protein